MWHRYTLSSPELALVFSSLNTNSAILFGYSVYELNQNGFLFSLRFSSELFATSFTTLIANFPQHLTAEDNTLSSPSDNLTSLATQMMYFILFLCLL